MRSITLLFKRIRNTSEYILIVDSVFGILGYPGYGYQFAAFEYDATHHSLPGGTGIHMRHTGMANIGFADGSVRACSKSQLGELGITKVFEKDMTRVDTN